MKIIIKSTDNGVLLYPNIGKLSDISGLIEALTRNNISYNDKFISIPLDDDSDIETSVIKVHRIFEEHLDINLFVNDVTFEYLIKNRKVINIDGHEVNLYSAIDTAVGVLGALSPTDNLHYMYTDNTRVYLSSKIFKDNDKITFDNIKDYQLIIFDNRMEDNSTFNSIKSFISSKSENNNIIKEDEKIKLTLISNA